jgi:hypothetical protein
LPGWSIRNVCGQSGMVWPIARIIEAVEVRIQP